MGTRRVCCLPGVAISLVLFFLSIASCPKPEKRRLPKVQHREAASIPRFAKSRRGEPFDTATTSSIPCEKPWETDVHASWTLELPPFVIPNDTPGELTWLMEYSETNPIHRHTITLQERKARPKFVGNRVSEWDDATFFLGITIDKVWKVWEEQKEELQTPIDELIPLPNRMGKILDDSGDEMDKNFSRCCVAMQKLSSDIEKWKQKINDFPFYSGAAAVERHVQFLEIYLVAARQKFATVCDNVQEMLQKDNLLYTSSKTKQLVGLVDTGRPTSL